MEEKKREVEDYLKDLTEIKKMMDQSEDYGLIEVWVYWLYGLFITAGTLISYYLLTLKNLPQLNVFLTVWLPIFFLAGLAETIGWVRRMGKKSAPLLSRRFTKLGSAFLGLAIIVSIMVYFLIQADVPHAGIYMMLGAVPLFLYSQITFTSIIIEAWLLTGGGFLFLINNVSSHQGSLFAGVIVGIVYFILGFHVWYEEKQSNG
ncbi:MAG: hypothetical protein JEY91_06745 [Spirochaetaceae bacterium]|nr:hypothetical protein [Spirochaetaceae bacterium]